MNKINFTSLSSYITTVSYNAPAYMRSKSPTISKMFSDILENLMSMYVGTRKQKHSYIMLLNTLTYKVLQGDSIEFIYGQEDPPLGIEPVSDDILKSETGVLYIDFDRVSWDMSIGSIHDVSKSIEKSDIKPPKLSKDVSKKSLKSSIQSKIDSTRRSSKKSDISLTLYKYPRIDTSKIWMIGEDEAGRSIPIYMTLPRIPAVQRDISLTTNIQDMTSRDLLHLFPEHFIQTRRPEMYEEISGFDFDMQLGFIPKISGFTKGQVVDNIIKYPQFNYMYRVVDGERISFLKHIEIDGELIPLSDAINSVDDLMTLPHDRVYYWDYIVRRYLLERDYGVVVHKYPLYGSFDPFMTLIDSQSSYISWGYEDVLEIAKQCVLGRVNFYQSRNPIVRRSLS